MDYEKMSDEELYTALKQRFPNIFFKEVDDFNRQTVIVILKFGEDEARDKNHVQPENP